MRTRFYNPLLKRFMNADIIDGTIADSTTLNLYAYVNGNPISYVDPFGLSAERGQDSPGVTYEDVSSGIHTALDVVGFVPGVGIAADGINTVMYAAEGDWLNAGLSAGALVPVVGDIAASGKAVSKGVKVIDKATDMARVVDKVDDVNDIAKAGKYQITWKNTITATQDLIEGTSIPKSFKLNDFSVNGQTIWVHGNATKHMGEYVNSAKGSIIVENELLLSFQDAVEEILPQVKSGRNSLTANGWQIGINGDTGVIYHAFKEN